MLSSKIGHSLDPYLYRLYTACFRGKALPPNIISVFAFLFGVLSSAFLLFERLSLSGLFLLLSGLLDMLDGAVARNTNRVTAFGGFLDSVLDRYVDLALAFGIFVHFLKLGKYDFATMTFLAAIGIALVPYAKARAESSSLACNVGILERPERTMILLFGLFLDYLEVTILLLAVLTHVTVIQRIAFVREKARELRNET